MNATIVDHVDVNPNNNNRTREVGLEPKRYGVTLTVEGVKAKAKDTNPNENATYTLTVKNTGNALDNYTLLVDNPNGAAVANLSNNVHQDKCLYV